ncbi:MAG: hypothetical protein U1E42_03295 [Rhodospirillales bacterium]
MPGVAGVIGPGAPEECACLVRTMIASMQHRPAYVSGTYACTSLGIYAGWVAHPGSFAARQSAATGRGGTRLLFSGECISADDAPLSCAEDGLLLGRCDGADTGAFVAGLNGLFAGLLIDPGRQSAWLFNDRYGSERIYVCEDGERLLFASEAKALLSTVPAARAFDDEGVRQFLAYGSTFDGRSLFRGIKVLPGGVLWSFGPAGTISQGRYFQPEDWEAQPVLDERTFQRRFEDTFRTVLPDYVAGDNAVGISITGGLDTRMIMACLPDKAPPPVCYTYVGLDGRTLDARIGERVARARGLDHRDLRLGANFLSGFGVHVDRTVFVTDGCAGVLAAHEIPYSRQAAGQSPIRLTGNYGSEVLRGVSTFKSLRLAEGLFAPPLGQGSPGHTVPPSGHPIANAAFREVPWHLFGPLAAARSELTVRSPFLDNRIVRLAFQTPMLLRQSPDAALGLIRAGNPALVAIPTDRGLGGARSGIFAAVHRLFCAVTFKLDYLYAHGLPRRMAWLDGAMGGLERTGLLGLHKFLPYRAWFRRELAPYAEEVLSDSRTRRMPFWDGRRLPSIIDDHVAGRGNYVDELHCILTLEAVDRTLINGFARTGADRLGLDACAS